MDNERTKKVGAAVLGILVFTLIALGPASTAESPAPEPAESASGNCVTVDLTTPGVIVDPQSCKRTVVSTASEPLPTP